MIYRNQEKESYSDFNFINFIFFKQINMIRQQTLPMKPSPREHFPSIVISKIIFPRTRSSLCNWIN